MPMKQVSTEIDPSLAGRTVAAVLREVAGVSHSIAKGMVDRGLVTLGGRVLRDPARRLTAGERLEARFDPATRYHRKMPPGRAIGFRVLMEDDYLVVVEKQAGLITVPAPSHTGDTLVDRLVAMYASRGFKAPRLWIVHRIDRFTSGLVLFARSEAAAASLTAQFRRRTARREYLGICEGIPNPPEGRLRSWLKGNPRSLKVSLTRDRSQGQRAVCTYRVEERLDGAALVRITLETGRRNQIRVQFAGIKHPLMADRSYGRPSALIPRVALHAARLGFIHPMTGLPVRMESHLPSDMRRLLRQLRRSRPADLPGS